jgi:D-amino-acid dehydrogenase
MSRGHVVIIGAGIIGACCALEALRDGWEVTILEPGQPGGTQAASYGNGGWFSPASVVPMSMPGLWRKVPGFLADPLGPLTIRWGSLPGLLPWLWRFLRAGSSVVKVEAKAQQISALIADSPERHLALAREAGVEHLIQRAGLLYPFPDRAAFEAEALAWRLRSQNGVTWTELNADELGQTEPALARRYRFAVRVDGGANCRDPGGYVAALVAYAERLGARRIQGEAHDFIIENRRLKALHTSAGLIASDRAVIAAGIASARLAALVGDRVPLASERGYHVQITNPEAAQRLPMMPSDGKMATTQMNTGLRNAGQVELASVETAANWQRADVLLAHLQTAYPQMAGEIAPERILRWMGHRPATPDSLPVIAPARASADVIHAFGHGHIGLATGPITGRIVADLLDGRPAPAAYSAARF